MHCEKRWEKKAQMWTRSAGKSLCVSANEPLLTGTLGVEPARDAERSGLTGGFDFLRMGNIGVCTSREWTEYPGAVVLSAGSYRSLSSVLTPHLLCKVGTHPFRWWCLYGLLLQMHLYSAWLDQEPSCRPIRLWGPTIPQWCV